MPAHKKQHYLPAVYLMRFSVDKVKPTRRSKIWRCDGARSHLVPVESQCFEDYHYSKANPSQTEQMFQQLEDIYAECIRKIQNRALPTTRDYFGLILMMFDLHIRTKAYGNFTGQEGIVAYRVRLTGLRRELILGKKEGNPSDAEVFAHLKQNWRVRILSSSPDTEFVTSDNPSAWFTLGRKEGELDFVIMPLTPQLLAVAFDQRVIEVNSSQTSRRDEEILNLNHCFQALKCIYTAEKLNDEQQRFVSEKFKQRIKHRGTVDANKWEVDLLRLPNDSQLSFLRVKQGHLQ